MTALWGPAYDAELEYRRADIAAASRPRARRRGARTPRGRAAGRSSADRLVAGRSASARAFPSLPTGSPTGAVPATASPRR